MSHVVYVTGEEEWDGLYIDGVLAHEGHTLDVGQVLDVLHGRAIWKLSRVMCKKEWLDERGGYPDKYSDIPGWALK